VPGTCPFSICPCGNAESLCKKTQSKNHLKFISMPETTLKPTEFSLIIEAVEWYITDNVINYGNFLRAGKPQKAADIRAKGEATAEVLAILKSAEYSEPILIRVSKS
jgi:hypothetical protein